MPFAFIKHSTFDKYIGNRPTERSLINESFQHQIFNWNFWDIFCSADAPNVSHKWLIDFSANHVQLKLWNFFIKIHEKEKRIEKSQKLWDFSVYSKQFRYSFMNERNYENMQNLCCTSENFKVIIWRRMYAICNVRFIYDSFKHTWKMTRKLREKYSKQPWRIADCSHD